MSLSHDLGILIYFGNIDGNIDGIYTNILIYGLWDGILVDITKNSSH